MRDSEEIISIIPRCPTCGSHADYMVVNKKTGETKYFCELCGDVQLLNYRNNGWVVLHLA